MAVGIERQGRAFYQGCVDAVTDDKLIRVFAFLADAEQHHERLFQEMKSRARDYDLPESYPGEARSYVDSFVQGRVFAGPEEAAQTAAHMSDPREAIDYGIELEKASILFYAGMKEWVRASEKNALDEIITEEHGHIRRLLALKNEVDA
jgi:rubrerythrin